MAKAKYHKAQRVFVKPVGTWAYIEAVVPKWVKGCEEPIKIAYDVGMGREFAPEELEPESSGMHNGSVEEAFTGEWRIMRGQNRWKSNAAIIPSPAPIRWWSPPITIGAAGACPAPNTISIPIVSSSRRKSSFERPCSSSSSNSSCNMPSTSRKISATI